MIRETRVLIDPSDLLAIEITCRECQGRLSCPIGGKYQIPTHCPHCNAFWWSNPDGTHEVLQSLFIVQSFTPPLEKHVRLQLHIQDE